MANKRVKIKLIQITGTYGQLYGLDKDGRAWKYKPADHKRAAFWSRLTAHGSQYIPDEEAAAFKLIKNA